MERKEGRGSEEDGEDWGEGGWRGMRVRKEGERH